MLRRGCSIIIILCGALFAAYLTFFTRYFEWPGNLIAAGFGSIFGALGVSSLGHGFWAWRDMHAFARAERREPPADGQLVVVAGPIRPLGAPLTSPFGGESCVGYEYEVFRMQRSGKRNFTLSAQWGRLNANAGVLCAANGSTLSVPVTGPLEGTTLQGDGWSATLNSGWVVRPAARPGSFAIVREN